MFENIENLEIVSSLRRESRARNKIINRATNSFIIRTSGRVLYTFPDKSFIVGSGEMMFLPKGVCYAYETIGEEPSTYIAIHFEGTIEGAAPAVFSLQNFYGFEFISRHFPDAWHMGAAADKYNCLSLFYALLSHLSGAEHTGYAESKKWDAIENGVSYLKAHLYDPALKTERLSRLCGMSDTYFRKIFISRFGQTPQKYIATKRLLRARSILESGDFDSICEVALSAGYSDPLYFSKVFKKQYGIPPSSFRTK